MPRKLWPYTLAGMLLAFACLLFGLLRPRPVPPPVTVTAVIITATHATPIPTTSVPTAATPLPQTAEPTRTPTHTATPTATDIPLERTRTATEAPDTPTMTLTPFAAAPYPWGTPDGVLTVAPGDTLAEIAATQCGRAGLYVRLAARNGLDNPDLLSVGRVLWVDCG